jgi:1-acyl-sn-glycerol-3-phosphate acyltransferase
MKTQISKSLFFRTYLFKLGFHLITGIYGTFSFIVQPLPYRYRFSYMTRWAKTILFWLKISCQVQYEIHGKENIPTVPCIILSKHSSVWETFCLPPLFNLPAVIVKQSLLKIPFFGWMLRMCEPIAIDRKQGSSAMKYVLTEGKARLEKGRSVMLFPEGTRVAHGEKSEYKIGGVLLAKKTNRPILLVAHNAGKFWPFKHPVIYPGTITAVISELIQTEDKSVEELQSIMETWIENKVAEL